MQYVRNLLNEQRRRCVGSLMAYLEANIYNRLTEREQKEVRQRVLAVVGQYHDICLDMVKASVNEGALMNDDAAALLHRLSGEVSKLRRELHADR